MARYIDADKLCKGLREMASVQYPTKQNTILGVVSTIENTRTADVVEVKRGEWIYDHWCEFRCSICGHWSKTEPRGEENYCPNCGAKMKGAE